MMIGIASDKIVERSFGTTPLLGADELSASFECVAEATEFLSGPPTRLPDPPNRALVPIAPIVIDIIKAVIGAERTYSFQSVSLSASELISATLSDLLDRIRPIRSIMFSLGSDIAVPHRSP